jgi:NADPH2:quinone reductase
MVLSYGGNEAFNRSLSLSVSRAMLEYAVARVRLLAPDASCLLTGPIATCPRGRVAAITPRVEASSGWWRGNRDAPSGIAPQSQAAPMGCVNGSTAVHRSALTQVEAPVMAPGEVLVHPRASSFNHGELRHAQTAKEGTRLGWDFAGIVAECADDVTDFTPGDRVVGLSSKALARGAWAECIAVPANAMALLPADLDAEAMAALPVAGLTALHAVGADLLGRRILITGGRGGVGSLAIQLAAAAGATVIAQVRRSERVEFARQMGAHEVVLCPDGSAFDTLSPVDRVVDGVGGPLLTRAFARLRPGGVAVTYGAADTAQLSLSVWTLIRSSGATLSGLHLDHALKSEPASVGLKRLLTLPSTGQLQPPVTQAVDWSDAGQLAVDILDRRYPGKAGIRIE